MAGEGSESIPFGRWGAMEAEAVLGGSGYEG